LTVGAGRKKVNISKKTQEPGAGTGTEGGGDKNDGKDERTRKQTSLRGRRGPGLLGALLEKWVKDMRTQFRKKESSWA